MEIDRKKWDKLIEEHYLSCLKCRPDDYEHEHSREEMRDFWYSLLERNRESESDIEISESDTEIMIKAITHANNNGYNYHPV